MKNLAYCVASVQADLEDYASHGKKRLCHFANKGYRDLGFKGDNRVKTVYIAPNEVYKGSLPTDFAYHTKIGVNYHGQWITLTKNDNLFTSVPLDECGNDIFDVVSDGAIPSEQCSLFYAPHWRSGNFVGEMYSAGGGFSSLGGFKIDNHNNIIQFDPKYPKMMYAVEYVSDGSDADGSTLIPTIAVDYITKYIKHEIEDNRRGKNRDRALVYELWGALNRARQDYKDLLYLPSISEFCDASYQSYQSAPKR